MARANGIRLLCVVAAGLASAAAMSFPGAEESAATGKTVYLDQGWDDQERQLFYHVPQGSPIIPLDFFFALERIDSDGPFADAANLAKYGLIPEPPHAGNPHGLPVGLTEDRALLGGQTKYLGMNCAACHVGLISGNGVTVRVDGAPSPFDFWSFIHDMDAALIATLKEGDRFERFARRLGDGKRGALMARLEQVVDQRREWQERNEAATPPGPGRVDALNVILNQVTAMMTQRPENAHPTDSPVDYPFLWGAPYLTHVQYNGVADNAGAGAMARNVGQVLGVFGQVFLVSGTLPPGYPSTVDLAALSSLERSLETLTPPKWEDLADLGVVPPVDTASAERGQAIYAGACKGCHALMDGDRPGRLASVKVQPVEVAKVGTDPSASMNFVRRTAVAGPLEGRKKMFAGGPPICSEAFASDLLGHVTLGVLANEAAGHALLFSKDLLRSLPAQIKEWISLSPHTAESEPSPLASAASALGEHVEAARSVLEDLGELETVSTVDDCGNEEKPAMYRARPLNAVWATAPYLHNGSVPSIAALLTPPEDRPPTFRVGSRTIDPEVLGFESGPGEGRVIYDTSIRGNSNAGHEYGTTLSEQEKRDLIEYLKTL